MEEARGTEPYTELAIIVRSKIFRHFRYSKHAQPVAGIQLSWLGKQVPPREPVVLPPWSSGRRESEEFQRIDFGKTWGNLVNKRRVYLFELGVGVVVPIDNKEFGVETALGLSRFRVPTTGRMAFGSLGCSFDFRHV